MPEMPEVETVRRILNAKVKGDVITKVIIGDPIIIKDSNLETFAEIVQNSEIVEIKRYGKYLFFNLGEYTLISHLRMEGKYFIYDEDYQFTKHDHIGFRLQSKRILVYNDTRKFGTMHLCKTAELQLQPQIAKLGIEPLNPDLTGDYLQTKAVGKVKSVKEFLLDQSIVCGLGNIYVDEVLFLSRIHPKTSVRNIDLEQFHTITLKINEVIAQAIAEGGTTVKSFMASNEAHGLFQHQLRVYGRANQPCKVCNTPIEKIRIGGRGTHFCPKCQPLK